jgi:4-diphosphocytidyl-2-C-methyl-D-erythritol kinase
MDILIQKNIPIGAGLGGSSADTAAVIKGISRLQNLKINPQVLLPLGADVPYMFVGGNARIQGVGEIITPIALPKLYIAVVVGDGISISTRDSYQAYDSVGGDKIDIDSFLKTLSNPKNALQTASQILQPKIATLCGYLVEAGFKNVVMTGSGGGVVGYTTDKDEFENCLATLRDRTKNQRIKVYTD